jgi:hypothetical protein
LRNLVYLGIVNSIRNLGRSLLTIAAMALAALMMTSSLTLGEGYTSGRAAEYRAFLGGDVLVYPTWAWPTEEDVANLEPGQARLAVLPPFFGSPLRYFHPDYYGGGYLTTAPGGAPTYSMFRSRAALNETLTALQAIPEVESIVPYETAPIVAGRLAVVQETSRGRVISQVSLSGFFVRACPPNLLGDAGVETPEALRLVETNPNPPHSVMAVAAAGEDKSSKVTWASGVVKSGGRPVALSDGEILVAVVNRRAVISREDLLSRMVDLGLDGQVVRLTLPRIASGRSGLSYDFTNPVTVDIKIVGTYDVFSRLFSWPPARGARCWEQLCLEAPELLMPQAGLKRLLEIMGLPPGELPPVGALALRLRDQSKAEAVVPALRKAAPFLSVVTVAREAAFANSRELPETIYEAPPSVRYARPLSQPAIPTEAGSLFGVILFGFAGLVAAGNATLLVLTRRTEFAILKAIGLRGYEVALVVMVEVVFLSTLGLLLGFVAGEAGALPIILTNNIGLGSVLRALGRDFGIVAGATLGCSVLFSLVPMLKTLRITVSEAMRGNE